MLLPPHPLVRVRALALACGLLPLCGWAQASPEPAPDPEDTDAAPRRETVVRAPRPAQSASEVTLPTEVLQAAPRTSATDVLRLVPGLVASQHSGRGKAHQLFLRGFDAIHGQDVELRVGGIPVNEPSHIHAQGYADANFLIPEVVHALHVTEGSYRAWQGDFAVAGTVDFELGMPEPGALIAGTLGTFGERRLVAGVRPFTDDPLTFAAVELAGGDGFGPSRAHRRAAFLAQAVGRHSVGGGKLTLRVLLGSYTARFDSAGVLRLDDHEAGRVGFFDVIARGQGGRVNRHQLLLEGEWADGAARTRLSGWGALRDTLLRNNFTGYQSDPRGDGVEQRNDGAGWGLEVSHRRRLAPFGRTVLLHAGAGLRTERADQREQHYLDPQGSLYGFAFDGSFGQTDAFAFAEGVLPLEAWRFMLGGRADLIAFHFTDQSVPATVARSTRGTHVGAKVGVERSLGEASRLFVNYGDGFRSPHAGALILGETALAPFVSVRGGEVGICIARAWLAAQAALFTSWVEDDVVFDHAASTTVSMGTTVRGGATVQGLLRPWADGVAALSATYAQAVRTDDGSLLPYFAPLVVRADLGQGGGFDLAGRTWRAHVGAGLTFIGARPLPFSEFSAPTFLADVGAEIRTGPVGVRLDVHNVLDTRWRDGEFVYASYFRTTPFPSRMPARHFTAGAPRELSLTLELHL